MTDLRERAFDAFNYGISINTNTDLATCQLHEDIAGRRYGIHDADDDPIYTITGMFTHSECRRFIKGVIEIVNKYAPDALNFDEWIDKDYPVLNTNGQIDCTHTRN